MKKLSVLQAIVILVPCAILNSIGMDLFAPAIPNMIEALNTTEQQIQLIAITFTLAVGIGQPVIGLACDKFGRRKTMLISVLIFVITSFATTSCKSIESLALLRFLQGLGACGSLVVTFAVVNDLFDEQTSFRIFSLIGCALALTPMIAPIVGVGLMYHYGGWEVCFLFLGLISLISAVLCYYALPETKPQNTIIPNFNNMAQNYKTVFTNKRFLVYTFFGTISMTELYLYFSIGNILYINKLGCTPFEFSMIFAINAIIYLLANYISTHVQKNLSVYRIAMIGGSLVLAGSLGMFVIRATFGMSVIGVMIPNSIMTIGVGLMIGPATGAALQPFKELAGTASGLFGTLQYGLPAIIGFIITRFEIHSSLSIAIPMTILSILCLTLANWHRLSVNPISALQASSY